MASQEHSQSPADGSNQPTPENVRGVAAQQQGEHNETKHSSSEGHHGGNHGNDANDQGARAETAKGSSHEGHNLDAQDRNDGGGSDAEHKNQTKERTEYRSDYGDGNAAPSPANTGGKIGDANNPV